MEHYLDLVLAPKYTEEPIPTPNSPPYIKTPKTQWSTAVAWFAFLALGDYEPGLRGDGQLWVPSEQLLSALLDHKIWHLVCST